MKSHGFYLWNQHLHSPKKARSKKMCILGFLLACTLEKYRSNFKPCFVVLGNLNLCHVQPPSDPRGFPPWHFPTLQPLDFHPTKFCAFFSWFQMFVVWPPKTHSHLKPPKIIPWWFGWFISNGLTFSAGKLCRRKWGFIILGFRGQMEFARV